MVEGSGKKRRLAITKLPGIGQHHYYGRWLDSGKTTRPLYAPWLRRWPVVGHEAVERVPQSAAERGVPRVPSATPKPPRLVVKGFQGQHVRALRYSLEQGETLEHASARVGLSVAVLRTLLAQK
jgi:hypothetical protein